MNKEDLLKLKEKISKLSGEEKKQRDLYLRGLSTGEIQGPMTGYATIDMPQLQFYKMDEYLKSLPKQTITEALFANNADNLKGIAHDYFFTKITYKKFMDEIKNLSKALDNCNVKKGQGVAICLAGIPEAYSALYACGMLGSIAIYLAPYLDIDSMINDIKKDNSKVLFIMDLFYEKGKEKFDKVIEECGIEKVVIVPTLNSSILGKFKKQKKYNNPKFETYNDFLKQSKNRKLPKMVEYEPNMPAAVVYSSGTTGILKGVLLSHDSINNSATSYLPFGFDLSRKQKFYQAIPVWSSTGLVADGSSILYYGATLHENPKFDPKTFSMNLGIHRDNWGIATTELFNGISDLSNEKKFNILLKLGILDYSQLKNIYIGGTLSTPKDKKRLEATLKSVKCSAQVNSSYGTCENGSIVTAELNGYKYPDYSVGIPIPGVSIMIIDENGNELPYNERGEIVISTPCGMLKYYNRADLNEKIFIKNDNTVYKHTGDIGRINQDGVLIYEGRQNDNSIINNKKIYNFDIKRVISYDDDVFDCEVFINKEGNLCANIVFYDQFNIDINDKLKMLQSRLFDEFEDSDYIPEYFKIWESFPMASSTKRDFKTIKNDTKEFIYVKNEYQTKTYKKTV